MTRSNAGIKADRGDSPDAALLAGLAAGFLAGGASSSSSETVFRFAGAAFLAGGFFSGAGVAFLATGFSSSSESSESVSTTFAGFLFGAARNGSMPQTVTHTQ